jgi:hypothetical protein
MSSHSGHQAGVSVELLDESLEHFVNLGFRKAG